MMLCPADTNEKILKAMLSGFFGAATQIRTGDLILTKDVLYQLSHSSVNGKDYSRDFRFCQPLKSKKIKKLFLYPCVEAKFIECPLDTSPPLC